MWTLGESVYEPNMGPLAWCTAKPIYWHQVVGKESTAFIARRTSHSCSKDPNSPMTLREGFLKTVWGRGNMLMFWGISLTNSLVPTHHEVSMLVVSMQLTSSTWGDFSICKTTQGYGRWGGTKGSWLCFTGKLIILSCLTVLFFLHFLTSLIKFALWNSGTA